jgi:hypothetical protein
MQLSSALLTNELVIINSNDKKATFVYTIVKDKIKYGSEENSDLHVILDANNNFISGTYYKDEIKIDNVEIKQTVLTNNNTVFGKDGWATPVDVPCGQVVYNGFIIYDMETGQVLGFLIVSVVNGFCPPTGGGEIGGGSAPPPVVDCSNASAFVNSITHTVDNAPLLNYYMGPITTASNGIIRRPVSPVGAAHHFNFILGMQATYKAHFAGVIYKNNASDP